MKKSYLSIALFALAAAWPAYMSANPYSQYLSKVYEFMPAPGQFVNSLPEYETGDDAKAIADKCTELLANNAKGVVSLGAYGGYIVFGFDHPVTNVADEPDFIILGNAFYSTDNPNPNASKESGSCEPGIIMVSRDANNNGLPDDEWYELKGSEYSSSATIHNYFITYYRPDADKTPAPNPDDDSITDTTYIKWEDNQGNTGYIEQLFLHPQSYWPGWKSDQATLTFTGSRLADNAVDESNGDLNFVLYAYPWGYADNHPNKDDRNKFDIENAVDAHGQSVHLDEIDFIKVYTGVNQKCSWLGETSTEVCGAEDLHTPTGICGNAVADNASLRIVGSQLIVERFSEGEAISVYDMSGRIVARYGVGESRQTFTLNLGKGIYVAQREDYPNQTLKFIMK